MPKSYSESWNKTVNSISADEFPLVLMEIDRDDLSVPIRLVNDHDDIVHNGNTFTAMPFRVGLPDEPEQGLPRASLAIDNVGKALTSWIENADWSLPTTANLIQVMRSSPDVAEWSVVMDMTDVAMTSLEVTARLGFEDLFASSGVNLKYTPHTSRGLF